MLAEAELKTIVELRFAPNNSQALLGAGTAGRMRDINVGFIELATALGPTSTLERAVVYRRFDHILKSFGGRPHLGKECSMHESEMAAIYRRRCCHCRRRHVDGRRRRSIGVRCRERRPVNQHQHRAHRNPCTVYCLASCRRSI